MKNKKFCECNQLDLLWKHVEEKKPVMKQDDQLKTMVESKRKRGEDEHERLENKPDNVHTNVIKEGPTKLQNDDVQLPKDVNSQNHLVRKEVIHKKQETAPLTINKKQNDSFFCMTEKHASGDPQVQFFRAAHSPRSA
mgnify:CR=1 FL=1